MAKKQNKYDLQHLRNLGLTGKQIEKIYDLAVKEAAAIGASIHDFNPEKPFSFADYPRTKDRIDRLIKELQKNAETAIVNGVRSEWTLANNKNNALCDLVFGENKSKLSREQERRYYSNNDKALDAFLKRKTAGLNLSDRVWNYSSQFKSEIEMSIDLGLRDGLPAAEMARDLKQYLQYPDKLFRRVRDEHGQLHLSKAAKDFHPGQGVYRSSYKNAMRLARTENNMAYRTADHERWEQLDFVVGVEIHLSNSHPVTDICDTLQGKYPKDFKFTGWHPQCFCYAVSILKTPEELAQENEAIMDGEEPDTNSVNEIKDVPDNFKKWVKENSDRIEKAEKRGTLPYFIKDNQKIIKTEPEPEPEQTARAQENEKTLYDKVVETENSIRKNKNFETAVAFDQNGNIVINKPGAATSVSFTEEEALKLKDTVFTHNHPRSWAYPENTIGRIGSSFSSQDIYLAINRDLAEMRAVTPTYTFIMKRPKEGWPPINLAKLEFTSADMKVERNARRVLMKSEYSQLSITRANTIHFHQVWKLFVKTMKGKGYNFEYSKHKSI